MDVNKKKVVKAVLIVVLILIILLLGVLYWRGKTYSKYGKEINSESMAEVAKPIFVVDGADNILIDGIQDKVYEFSVKNYDNTGVSDVEMKYNIQIVNNSQADLSYQLTKDGKTINLSNNKTATFSLSGINKQSDDYKLTIKYKNNPAITNDIAGNVQIKVEAEQAEIK